MAIERYGIENTQLKTQQKLSVIDRTRSSKAICNASEQRGWKKYYPPSPCHTVYADADAGLIVIKNSATSTTISFRAAFIQRWLFSCQANCDSISLQTVNMWSSQGTCSFSSVHNTQSGGEATSSVHNTYYFISNSQEAKISQFQTRWIPTMHMQPDCLGLWTASESIRWEAPILPKAQLQIKSKIHNKAAEFLRKSFAILGYLNGSQYRWHLRVWNNWAQDHQTSERVWTGNNWTLDRTCREVNNGMASFRMYTFVSLANYALSSIGDTSIHR